MKTYESIRMIPELTDLLYQNSVKMMYITELIGRQKYTKQNRKLLDELFNDLWKQRIRLMEELAEYIPYQKYKNGKKN